MQDANGGLKEHIKTPMHAPQYHHENPGMRKAHGKWVRMSEDALGESARPR
jgi:hypothetical protein